MYELPAYLVWGFLESGKSTLIKVLTGVHDFESGSIHMNGENKDIINNSF